MARKTFFYGRVSSKEQHVDRQVEAFKKLGAEDRDIFIDKQSGKNLEREKYQALRNTLLRPGDTLVIKELDRLSRNKADIKDELKYYQDNNIRVKILDIPTTLVDFPENQQWVQDMITNILIEVLSSIAQEERLKIRRRQREGIDAALRKGVQFGRRPVEKPENWDEVISIWKKGEITAVKAMELTDMKKTTFYKMLKEN